MNQKRSSLHGNQNARKNGWWSRQRPLTDAELRNTIATLALTGRYKQLRELARAISYSRDKALGRRIRKLATALQRQQILTAAELLRQGLGPEGGEL